MSNKEAQKKEVQKIASRLIVKAFLHDDLEANSRDRAWEDGRAYLMLDDRNPVVRAHRTDRVVIPDDKILECLNDDSGTSTWTRMFGGTKVTGTIILTTDTTIRLVVKLTGTNRDADAPEGKAVLETTVAEISRCLDVQKLCLPMAGRVYRTLRTALYRGDSAEIDTVQRGLSNRLWQLGVLAKCKDEGLRNALGELIAINDVFFENALEVTDSAQAIEMIATHIAGNVELNVELGAKVQEARDRIAAEKARKSRAITTVADVMEEKKREQRRRDEMKAKRAKRTAASAPISAKDATERLAAGLGLNQDDDETVENDMAEAGSAETESGETDDRETEGLPEVPPSATDEDASTRLTPKQQRMMEASKNAQTAAANPAPEAPKPTETVATATKKAEPVKLDFKAALAARKVATPVAAESAPVADAAPASGSTETE